MTGERAGTPRATAPRGPYVVAGLAVAVLVLAAGRYGLHRDELYFLEAGRHPAFGYPDQPPVVPLLAAGWSSLVGGSPVGLRLLPALVTGGTVLVAAATSRRLGGTAADQTWTAAVTALATAVLVTGHLFSTTTFDVALTAGCVLLLLRALDSGAPGAWLALGLLAGLALQVKTLPATVLAACAAGLLLVGPRRPLRGPWPWAAAGIAVLVALPNLLWQAANGWPQLELARAIAAGSSGTSAQRWQVVPFQLLIVGPVVAVVLVTGLLALLRDPALRPHRWVAVGYLVLLVVVLVTGGKPYYTLGLVPALLAAGVPAVRRWQRRGRAGVRRRAVAGLLVVHAAVTAVVALPVLPVPVLAASPVPAVNPDAAETVGWDSFVATVGRVAAEVPAQRRPATVVLTGNYGEAGALDRARRGGADLPPVYSGHNGYGLWGPPPASAATVVVVGGWTEQEVDALFAGCRVRAVVDNGEGLDNAEQGRAVRLCSGPRRSWQELWPDLRRLG